MARALFLLLVAPLAAITPADAQTGGIQVAPVMVAMSGEDTISSLRVRNGRIRPVAFEIDAYAWSQQDGQDILTPTRDLIVAPGVFEIAANGEQVIRLGVRARASAQEQSYRIVMRELPGAPADGVTLGFSLEMSLPVFVSPTDARANLLAEAIAAAAGDTLVLENAGNAHVQLAAIQAGDGVTVDAPRYLLAGSSARVPLPADTRSVHIRLADRTGASERVVHVRRQDTRASVR